MASGARFRAAFIWAAVAGLLVLALATFVAPRQAVLTPPAPPPVAAPVTTALAPRPPPASQAAQNPTPSAADIVKQLGPGGEAKRGIRPTDISDPSQVDAALRNLASGTVAFTAPAKMAVSRAGEVRVLLSARKQVEELLAQLHTGGQSGGGSIMIADRMQATLTGDEFSISPDGPQVQAISKEADNTWQWVVSPKSAGDDVLVLRLDAVLKVDGTDTPRFLTTFEKHIAVDVGWPTDFHGWTTLARQTFDDVKWIATTLAAVLAALVGWCRRKPTTG